MKSLYAYAAAGIAVTVVVVTGVVAFGPLGQGDTATACSSSTVAGGSAAIGGPFTLLSEANVEVSDADVITGPTLVYFGYTYCPDVCPLDTARNADAIGQLRDGGRDAGHLFITVDPERDTPEVLTEFTGYFDDDLIGLTGTEAQVTAAAKAYRVYFKRQPGDTPDDPDYLVDHSAFTYLMGPGGELLDLYRRDTSAEAMAQSMACFIDKA